MTTIRYETLLTLSQNTADEALALDLQQVSHIAQSIQHHGGRALVVGGFVRDLAFGKLTGQSQTPKDMDVEVYGMSFGALFEILQDYGRTDMVGASFGIIKLTCPVTGNILDFSIPRRDSKNGVGHRGFNVIWDPGMTVREAARRRDLTINALALDPLTGELFDEYGGLEDLRQGVLRATDPELFADDPLRVLRVVQFAGRFGFRVDPATAELCRSLNVAELPRERIGEEWLKLMTKSQRPSIGLEIARQLGVLAQLHPELAVLDTIPQEPDWHPEGDVWEHTKHAADAAAWVVRQERLTGDDALVVLFGALCHDLGKATTTAQREKHGVLRWTAYGHEEAGVEPARRFLSGLKLNQDVINKILPIIREHLYHIGHPQPTDTQLRKFAGRLQPASIRLWDLVSRCDSNGRGEAFQAITPSHTVYLRSLELQVSEKPSPYIVQGRDLITRLQLKPGTHFRPILDYLYEAQLQGAFTTPEAGIVYYQEHEAEIQAAVSDFLVANSRPRHGKTTK